jgi:hypothetical protein
MPLRSAINILVVVLCVSCFPSRVFAQNIKYIHPFDFKKFNLGLLMGMNYNMYNLKDQIQITEGGVTLEHITAVPKPGLSLGMITSFKLHNNFDFRFIPQVSLEQRDFKYRFEGDSIADRKIEAAYLNLPFLLQIKSDLYEVYRLYVLAGMQLGVNMNSNKRVRDNPNLLKIKTTDVSLVVGVGFNIYGDRIKLSPEIIYTAGISNVYVPEYTSHAGAISLLFSQVLKFNINFE